MRTATSSVDERAPLLQYQFPGSWPSAMEAAQTQVDLSSSYKQFCQLVGNRPADWPKDKPFTPPHDSLYARAIRHRYRQSLTYAFAAAMTNTLLLSQVVLGAALTGLGASQSSHILITVFGALNTVIAGVVAFVKSRGQPMRARMFRDDLDRVVDEIENSATMWQGISANIHGYDAIDTEDAVTVRSEVARLTRLYDRAVRINTLNDPDFYGTGSPSDPHSATLKAHNGQFPSANAPPAGGNGAVGTAPAGATTGSGAPADEDESPATKARAGSTKTDDKGKAPAAATTPPAADEPKATPADTPAASTEPAAVSAPAPAPAADTPAAAAAPAVPSEAPAAAVDVDASPATARDLPKAADS